MLHELWRSESLAVDWYVSNIPFFVLHILFTFPYWNSLSIFHESAKVCVVPLKQKWNVSLHFFSPSSFAMNMFLFGVADAASCEKFAWPSLFTKFCQLRVVLFRTSVSANMEKHTTSKVEPPNHQNDRNYFLLLQFMVYENIFAFIFPLYWNRAGKPLRVRPVKYQCRIVTYHHSDAGLFIHAGIFNNV